MSARFKFGDRVEGIHASESNPRKYGIVVRYFRRTGKMNPGPKYEITDGNGNFWESPAEFVKADTRFEIPKHGVYDITVDGEQLSRVFLSTTGVWYWLPEMAKQYAKASPIDVPELLSRGCVKLFPVAGCVL